MLKEERGNSLVNFIKWQIFSSGAGVWNPHHISKCLYCCVRNVELCGNRPKRICYDIKTIQSLVNRCDSIYLVFSCSQQMAAHQGIACRVRDFPAAGGHRTGTVTFSAEGHVSPKGENPFCNTLNKSVGDKWRRKMASEQVPRSVAIEQMSIDPWIMEAVNKGDCFVKVKGWHAGPQLVAFQSGGWATANSPLQPCKYRTFLLFIAFCGFAFPFLPAGRCFFVSSSIFTVLFLIFFMHFIFSYFPPDSDLNSFSILLFPVVFLLSCHSFRILFLSFGLYPFTSSGVSHAASPITILSCSLYRNC